MKISGHHVRTALVALLLYLVAAFGCGAETMRVITNRDGLSSMSVFCLQIGRAHV